MVCLSRKLDNDFHTTTSAITNPYAIVNVKLQGGGGGGAGYPREFDSDSFSLGRDFDSGHCPWVSLRSWREWVPNRFRTQLRRLPVGREFDMAAILDGRENLEMSHRAKDLYCFFALFWSFFRHRFRHERTKGKQICFIFPQILAVAYF